MIFKTKNKKFNTVRFTEKQSICKSIFISKFEKVQKHKLIINHEKNIHAVWLFLYMQYRLILCLHF
jgi:hypothetical protein